MKITIDFLSMPVVTKAIGSESITIDFSGQTIKELITEIADRYGVKVGNFLLDESGNLDKIFKVFYNKQEWISHTQMDKGLKDGDKITLMLLVAGG